MVSRPNLEKKFISQSNLDTMDMEVSLIKIQNLIINLCIYAVLLIIVSAIYLRCFQKSIWLTCDREETPTLHKKELHITFQKSKKNTYSSFSIFSTQQRLQYISIKKKSLDLFYKTDLD